MRRIFSTLTLLTLLASAPGYALLEKLPFIGSDFPYEIHVNAKASLKDYLSDTLATAREESSEFKLYKDATSALHFDRSILKKALEARGYYLSKIASKQEGEIIQHEVTTGPLYKVKRIDLKLPEKVNPPSRFLLPIQEGAPLIAEKVLNTVDAINDYIRASYCLFDIDVSYKAEVDHRTQEAFLTFIVAPSPNVAFATPQLFGETSVAQDYLTKQITFAKGDCFNRTEIEKSRLALLQTNLIAMVNITVSEPIADEVSVIFEVTERSHRTIKIGAGYATDVGPSVLFGWEHRNLFGAGQKFESTLNFSDVEQSLDSSLTLPNFLRDDQIMLIESSLKRETPVAYEATQGEVTATISRGLRRHLTGSLGVGLEFSQVKKDGEVDDYGLLSFPVGLDFNDTNNIFDPKRGMALSLKARPYINLYQTGVRFLEQSVLYSTYFTKKDWPTQPTLALRVAMGSLKDASLQEVPADHRFYVGGGGSVRGYEYKSISALDDEEPIGGLSFSETSLELRLQFNQSWGGVLFVDGGYAYPGKTPKFFEDYLWSAGLGIRFFTNFAPIRLDIARPLDIRYSDVTGDRIDSPFQVYVSIGQAF